MTKTLLALAVAAIALGGAATPAQSDTSSLAAGTENRTNSRAAYRWRSGIEEQERETTRQLNNEQTGQPTPSYYAPQSSYVPPPQYSYAPQPQYSYAPQPTYAYPYDYPPQPWTPRYLGFRR